MAATEPAARSDPNRVRNILPPFAGALLGAPCGGFDAGEGGYPPEKITAAPRAVRVREGSVWRREAVRDGVRRQPPGSGPAPRHRRHETPRSPAAGRCPGPPGG